jgi:oxygen-dependent protoporphyrinogen oxidase
MTRCVETLVVGAGISGLAYAHARGPQADLVVLEGAKRAGGLVHTERLGAQGEFRAELGPESLRFEVAGGLTDMLRELGLEARKPPANASKRFLVHRGRLVDAPLGPKMITTPLLTLGGKLRLASEPFRDPRVALDGSVADFVRHRIGEQGLDALLDPLVSGIHAGDPEQLSMRACFPRLVELVETHGGLFKALFKTRGDPAPSVMKPVGGCDAIVSALTRALGEKIVLDASVGSLAFDGETWRVRCTVGEFEAARLVLALPAASAARLLSTVAPSLARPIGSIASESLVSVTHVWRRADVGHPLDGFGYLVASRERMRHLGTLFSSSIAPDACPPSHVVLRTLLGGARRPETIDLGESELLAIVRSEVRALLELRGEPELVRVQRWRATLPRFDLAHPDRVAAIESACPPSLVLLGNWLRGIGVNHLVAHARTRAAQSSAAR